MKKFLVLAALISTSAATSICADTLATWTFETEWLNRHDTYSPGANTATTNFLRKAGCKPEPLRPRLFMLGSLLIQALAGNGSTKSLSANNWSVGDYWQLQLSTVGFSGLSLSYDQTGSATGPQGFRSVV